jgi:hypothetical protein
MANIIYLKKIRQLWSTNPPISTKQITISHPNLLEIQVPGLGMAHNVVSLYWFLAWDIMWYLYTGSWLGT